MSDVKLYAIAAMACFVLSLDKKMQFGAGVMFAVAAVGQHYLVP